MDNIRDEINGRLTELQREAYAALFLPAFVLPPCRHPQAYVTIEDCRYIERCADCHTVTRPANG